MINKDSKKLSKGIAVHNDTSKNYFSMISYVYLFIFKFNNMNAEM